MSRCLADARWKRMWNHRLAYSGLFRLIPAYSGLFVAAVHASIWIRDRMHMVPKSDPPDYSVTGESTLGTLVIRGKPLSVELRPTKVSYGQMSIITIAQNEARHSGHNQTRDRERKSNESNGPRQTIRVQ